MVIRRVIDPSPEHQAFYSALTKALAYGEKECHLSQHEILAISAQIVGKVIACMDSTKYSTATAWEIVHVNIEIGNAQMLEQMQKDAGGIQ